MSAPLDCPGIECWPALLDASLPPEQRERYERHLESCRDCQDRLDRAEESGDTLRLLGRAFGDPTLAPADPTLVQVLERLHEGKAPAEPPDLYFLRPADRPDVLGRLGDYEVREVIGQGGMGIVLKAYEPALHRLVAIKVLSPALAGSATARRRFTREAQAAAAVCHDHVVAVHGVHEADGLPYLVMEYVAGESLQQRLDRAGPLPAEEVVRVGLQTASALAAAHAQGLIHRDVKPANLLLENGLARVKVTDFGLARPADDVGLTQTGVVAGTPEYMAPEQARGETVDHRADLFGLGAVLYACCTGQPPFRAATPLAVLRQVNDEAPVPVRELNPDVPAWLEALIDRLLAKEPGRRPGTAAEVAALLEGYLAHLRQPTTVPAPALPLPRAGEGRGRSRSVRRLGQRLRLPALLLLAALGLGAALWATGTAGGAKSPHTYYLSLKGKPEKSQGLELTGPDADKYVHFEPEGLRITLPADCPQAQEGVGLAVGTPVRGDFEITVSYEILAEPRPEEAGPDGTRVTLDAGLDRGKESVATLSRRVDSERGTGYLTWLSLWDEAAGQCRKRGGVFPTNAKAGRLRLARTRSVVSYAVSETPDGPFTVLRQEPFDNGDLEDVRIIGYTGDPKAAFDVRVTDLRIQAEALPKLAAAARPLAGEMVWLAAAGILALVIASASALGLWLYRRRRRRSVPEPAAAPGAGGLAAPAAAPPPVTCRCPGCGKNLRARAGAAGKKVKCPQCGQAVPVPGPAPAPSRRLSRRMWLLLGAASALVLVGGLALPVVLSRRAPRPGHPAPGQPQPYLNVTLGAEPVPGVEESGFSYQEYDRNRPFRWTDGDGRLIIPIDKAHPPQALLVQLVTYRAPGVHSASLEIRVNEHSLFHDQIHLGRWESVFDLKGIDLGDRLVLDLVSDTFSPLGNREGDGQASDDPRTLGVQVQGVRLLGPQEGGAGPAALPRPGQ